MTILNLTQHSASEEQIAAGVIEPSDKAKVKALLTFTSMPSMEEVWDRACELAAVADSEGVDKVMIGGAPYLMARLERALQNYDMQAVYAYSERVSTEIVVDGVTHKAGSFRHLGFV